MPPLFTFILHTHCQRRNVSSLAHLLTCDLGMRVTRCILGWPPENFLRAVSNSVFKKKKKKQVSGTGKELAFTEGTPCVSWIVGTICPRWPSTAEPTAVMDSTVVLGMAPAGPRWPAAPAAETGSSEAPSQH